MLYYKSNITLLFFLLLTSLSAKGQNVLEPDSQNPQWLDREPIKYAYLQESDVMWARRVWEIIDLRQKANHPLYTPSDSLPKYRSMFDILTYAITHENSLTAYSTGLDGNNDHFSLPLQLSQVDSILYKTDSLTTYNPTTDEYEPSIAKTDINGQSVTRYKIKEDWIFDKSRSELIVRIIGIAPQVEKLTDDGTPTGAYETLFWLYYPACREVLCHWAACILHNDAKKLSFEDIFEKRLFSGTVVKVSNVADRSINETAEGTEALETATQLRHELLLLESHLWSH